MTMQSEKDPFDQIESRLRIGEVQPTAGIPTVAPSRAIRRASALIWLLLLMVMLVRITVLTLVVLRIHRWRRSRSVTLVVLWVLLRR